MFFHFVTLHLEITGHNAMTAIPGTYYIHILEKKKLNLSLGKGVKPIVMMIFIHLVSIIAENKINKRNDLIKLS